MSQVLVSDRLSILVCYYGGAGGNRPNNAEHDMSNEINHLEYSLAIEKAAGLVPSWCIEDNDDAALVREASEAIDNPFDDMLDKLPNTVYTVADVVACVEATRMGVDWRAEYCRRHGALEEGVCPLEVARGNHYTAVDQVGSFSSIHESLFSYYENMRDTLRWSGYGTVTQELAAAEWNKLELARLTKLVNG